MRLASFALLAICGAGGGRGLALAPSQYQREEAVAAVDSTMCASALDQALHWLLEHQNADGSFGSHHSSRPIEVFCTPPGSHDAFRVATTALAAMALMDAQIWQNRGDRSELLAAQAKAIESLCLSWDVKRVDNLEHYSVWGLGYALRALSEQLRIDPTLPSAAELRAAAAGIISKLARYQALDGGFGYLSLDGLKTAQPSWTSMSFTTATIVIALQRARLAGLEVPDSMLQRAAMSIARTRMPGGFFTYGELWNRNPVAGINLEAGAACRGPGCLYALQCAGAGLGSAEAERCLQSLLIRQARFQQLSLRRPIPHESWYAISGYFYLYGHAYAAWLMEEETPAVQALYAKELARAVLLCRQPDGSFWDYPLYSYHKPYGSAYAVIALARARAWLARVESELPRADGAPADAALAPPLGAGEQ